MARVAQGSPGAAANQTFIAGQRLPAPRTRPVVLVHRMPHRRRRVFVDTAKGRVSAGFSVPETDDAADVSMKLRQRGWMPYRLRLEAEQNAWVATVIDWQRAA